MSRVRSVPSTSIVHTSSKLSNAIRPESEDRFPLLDPGAAEAVVDEAELSRELVLTRPAAARRQHQSRRHSHPDDATAEAGEDFAHDL